MVVLETKLTAGVAVRCREPRGHGPDGDRHRWYSG